MAEIVSFMSVLMGLRSHNTCNQGNKYMEICRTMLYTNTSIFPKLLCTILCMINKQ